MRGAERTIKDFGQLLEAQLAPDAVSARGDHLDGGRRLVGFDLPLRRTPWHDNLTWTWPSGGEN